MGSESSCSKGNHRLDFGHMKTLISIKTDPAVKRGVQKMAKEFGMNAAGFKQYIEHIADRRLERVGLPTQFNVTNPFPWMSEAVDLSKEKNFFETRVTEYRTGGALKW